VDVILAGVERAGSPNKPQRRGETGPLTAQVYEQLRVIAQARLQTQASGHTLQATALVNEAYLKLRDHPSIVGDGPADFYRAAALAMRQILIDHARGKGRVKRGGGAGVRRELVDVAQLAADDDGDQILAVDEAIERLAAEDPAAAEVVRLRFYAGLSVEETAATMGVSERTVKRDWQFARAWLYRELG
jgi:RNA polymerase sigma factor (TIGR02999 family)